MMEHTEIFSRSLGTDSDVVMKEMYSFKDASGQDLTLRPEGTAGVVRALLSHKLVRHLPQRLYYSGPMFRYEKPQRGRARQVGSGRSDTRLLSCVVPSVWHRIVRHRTPLRRH